MAPDGGPDGSQLPVMTAAFAAGELDKTKVRELVAVATPSTESAWVDRAKALPNRAVEALVAAVGPDGMPPDEIPEPPLNRPRRRQEEGAE